MFEASLFSDSMFKKTMRLLQITNTYVSYEQYNWPCRYFKFRFVGL